MQTNKKETLRRIFTTYINGDTLTICDAKTGRALLMAKILIRTDPELIFKFSDKLQSDIADFVKEANWVNSTRFPQR